ncbi:uncharacterized protein LOC142802722 isoform X2 [Rhipicephalus microplus]|uniref:uncharacterized protein LOC142802722 isoform X2 n=1 Tax=Rhipicephalus microplus TaxID=6941 RepID=UPI003F6C74F5
MPVMGTPVKSAFLKHGVVPSTNVNEQNASEPPRAVLMETPKLEILKRLLFGGTAILYPPKASHRSEGDHDDFTRGPVDGAAPGLACDLGQRVQTSPEPACEMDEVTEKSVQVQLYTRHEASQANENKILSTSATQTEPHAFSSGRVMVAQGSDRALKTLAPPSGGARADPRGVLLYIRCEGKPACSNLSAEF